MTLTVRISVQVDTPEGPWTQSAPTHFTVDTDTPPDVLARRLREVVANAAKAKLKLVGVPKNGA